MIFWQTRRELNGDRAILPTFYKSTSLLYIIKGNNINFYLFFENHDFLNGDHWGSSARTYVWGKKSLCPCIDRRCRLSLFMYLETQNETELTSEWHDIFFLTGTTLRNGISTRTLVSL